MKEFRDRVLIPTLVPLAALGIIAVVVLNVSRLLIALHDRSGPNVVTALAVILSAGILFGFTWYSARGTTRSTTSVSLMSVAGIMVILAGLFGAEALHEEELEKKAHEQEQQVEPDLVVEAFDIGWRQTELTIGPGNVTVEMVNTGAIAHTFVLEGVPAAAKLTTPGSGDRDAGSFEVQPGNYTYFCDIPGHRQGGMEGQLIVDPSAPPPGGGGGGGGAAADPSAPPPGGGGGGGGPAGPTPLNIEGGDIFFQPKEVTAPAGPVAITLTNKGLIQHNLVVQEDPSFETIDVNPGQSGTSTLDAKPGTYTIYCDIPGHRAAGMEAKLTVT